MRLAKITVGTLRAAAVAHLAAAWGRAAPPPPDFALPDETPLTEALPVLIERRLVEDASLREDEWATRRYALRLGQPNYGFLKLMLQEHLVEGEFFFEVDTHDQMFREEGDEAGELAALKADNQRVKLAVEAALGAAGLPTAAHLKGVVDSSPHPREPSNGRRLLLVDDDVLIADTLATLLRGRGYEVEQLSDGWAAVERADPARHDLVLMDNDMPGLNGFEACRQIKASPATARLKVIIATAGSLTLSQLDAADGFLVKPFRVELLLNMLDHLLGRRTRV